MSFVSDAEMLTGAERSSRRARVIQRLQRRRQEFIVLYPDNPAICQHDADQLTALKTAETPIGANDRWIACPELAESASPVTNNTREFQRISGLRLENRAV